MSTVPEDKVSGCFGASSPQAESKNEHETNNKIFARERIKTAILQINQKYRYEVISFVTII
jgi:hypothetical protein